jgi:hypothetical protein
MPSTRSREPSNRLVTASFERRVLRGDPLAGASRGVAPLGRVVGRIFGSPMILQASLTLGRIIRVRMPFNIVNVVIAG